MDKQDIRLIEYRSAIVPVYYCLGARLRILDLAPNQQGQTVVLLFRRDGDCALVPTSDIIDRSDRQQWQRRHDDSTIHHAAAQLAHDGWELCGKLTLIFEGEDYDNAVSA